MAETSNSLRVIPLGGVGETGMNCLVLALGERLLILDCGVKLTLDALGVELCCPDFSWLAEREHHINALIITHGHDDHIGAVPFFVQKFPRVPIYGPRHAIALMKLGLSQHGVDPSKVDFRTIRTRRQIDIGCFGVEAFRVAHSTADAVGYVVRTSLGTIVHSGDFKFVAGRYDDQTDVDRLRDLGREGTSLLLSDSTNSMQDGYAPSESAAENVIAGIIAASSGRVVVGLFSSNIPRLRAIGRIARSTKRHILLLGNGPQTHVRVGYETSELFWPSNLPVNPTVAESLPRRNLLVVASGTQAERHATLWKLSKNVHPLLFLESGDTVILSSRILPGRENDVDQMIGQFLRLGVDVHSPSTDPLVTVSGHGFREDKKKFIECVQPNGFIPIHGDVLQLHQHAMLARSLGTKHVMVIESGQSVALADNGALMRGCNLPHLEPVFHWRAFPVGRLVLEERTMMHRFGIMCVSVWLQAGGQPAVPATVVIRGVSLPVIPSRLAGSVTEFVAKYSNTQILLGRPTERKVIEAAVRSFLVEHLAALGSCVPEIWVTVNQMDIGQTDELRSFVVPQSSNGSSCS